MLVQKSEEKFKKILFRFGWENKKQKQWTLDSKLWGVSVFLCVSLHEASIFAYDMKASCRKAITRLVYISRPVFQENGWISPRAGSNRFSYVSGEHFTFSIVSHPPVSRPVVKVVNRIAPLYVSRHIYNKQVSLKQRRKNIQGDLGVKPYF